MDPSGLGGPRANTKYQGCSPALLIHSTAICRKETRRGVNLLNGRAL